MDELEKAKRSSSQIYNDTRQNRVATAKARYAQGLTDRYQYVSEMYEVHRGMFEIASALNNTPIRTIEISAGAVVFSIEPFGIEMEVDQAARSAPLEMINFGGYELDDVEMSCALISDEAVVLDIGAHMGWFCLNLAKRVPSVSILAFEPILPTFQLLQRNVARNNAPNVQIFNYGFGESECTANFYYSEIGSTLASRENISDLESFQRVPCELTTLDSFANAEQIDRLDFIKCDVEGGEFSVVKGGIKMLEAFTPIVLLEIVESWCEAYGYRPHDLIEQMQLLGYNCYAAEKARLLPIAKLPDGDPGKYNYFFLHPKKHRSQIAALVIDPSRS